VSGGTDLAAKPSRGSNGPLAWAGATVALALIALFLLRPAGRSPEPDPSAAALVPENAAIARLAGPPLIAIQAGHYREAELPDELARLRGGTGASFGGVREVDVNRSVAISLARMVEAAGWKAILLPATVPPGLRADAFVAIHADWGDSASKRGWKLSPPWRASEASKLLSSAIAWSFRSDPSLVEDSGGVTIAMRGYYAFSYRRFAHAASPFTPGAILELGFITNPEERRSLAGNPRYWAGLVMRGLEAYLENNERDRPEDLRPAVFPWVAAQGEMTFARAQASLEARILAPLEPGRAMLPVDDAGAWLEIFLPGRRETGWVLKSELTEAPAPALPLFLPTGAEK
jgi:hypothetical protein